VLLKIQIDYLVGHITSRLAGVLQSTIKKELSPMVDVVADLRAQVQETLAAVNALLAQHADDVAKLAAIPVTPDNTADLEAQIAALKDGTAKVTAALASATAAVAAPVASAGAAAAPADAPAPAAPADSAAPTAPAEAPAATPAAPGTTA
jgi:cell division protein FtsB